MTLKVGDRVKTVWGDVGTVACLRVTGEHADVLIPGQRGPSSVTPGAGTYRIDSLEKIEDSPRFKVGDRVRSLNHRDSTVIVTDGTSVAIKFVRARFDHGGHGLWVESELEKVGVPFKLERGDKVVNRLTGREGTVVEGSGGVLWVVDYTYSEDTGAPAQAVEEYELHYPGTYDLIKKDAPW